MTLALIPVGIIVMLAIGFSPVPKWLKWLLILPITIVVIFNVAIVIAWLPRH